MNQIGQNTYGYTDWNLPSPSSTPKSATFHESSLRTPKTEAFQSHFLDAFSTPRFNGNQTPTQTLHISDSTSIGHPGSVQTRKGLSPEDPEFHVNHFLTNQHLPLPPVDASRRLSSSPDPLSSKSDPAGTQGRQGYGQVNAMDLSQMQTPPPTRGSSSDRTSRHFQGSDVILQSPVTFTPVAPGPVDLHFGAGFVSPGQPLFSSVQFSPDTFQFSSTGQTPEPSIPRSRPSWNSGGSGSMIDENAMAWQPVGGSSNQVQGQFVQPAHGLPDSGQPLSFVIDSANLDATSLPQVHQPMNTCSGVDPSLLFSFSGATITPFNPAGDLSTATLNIDHVNRQPYEQQTRELEREREMARKVEQHQPRSNTTSSVPLRGSIRPDLQRSNTDSGFRRSQVSNLGPRSSSSNAGYHIPRRSSPLKQQQSHGSLFSIPETSRPRPRTRLIIDETGRARTETEHSPEDDTRSNSKSQYPELWVGDGSDTEPDEPVKSRPSSFIIAPPSRQGSKHGRNDSDQDSLKSFKMPRPLSSISLGNGSFSSSPQKPDGQQSNSFRRFSMSSFGGLFGEIPKAEEQDLSSPSSNPDGDAQNALKRVVKDRLRRQEVTIQNKRWSQASVELTQATQKQYHYPASFTNSPQGKGESEFATPRSDRSSSLNDEVRCVCNSTDGDGQMMIQCESCTKWLHLRCVGLKSNNLPPVYVCVICTGQTPAVRGGRIRDPIRSVSLYASPLMHKSTYRS